MIEYLSSVLSGVGIGAVVVATLTVRGWVYALRSDLTAEIHRLELLIAKLPGPSPSSTGTHPVAK